jgi:hypothetical protein
MKFAVIVYETQADMNARSDLAKAPAYWASYQAYSKALVAAGVAAGGAGLEPPSRAATIRVRDGSREVQDGPFADTKEQLGGFFVIDVPDLETALMWAAKCPSATSGSVEVRPLLPPPPQ